MLKVKAAQSCLTLCDPMDYTRHSLGQNTWVGSLYNLQGVFPTQGWKPGLSHCRQILYQLRHKGSPTLLQAKRWGGKKFDFGHYIFSLISSSLPLSFWFASFLPNPWKYASRKAHRKFPAIDFCTLILYTL